MTARYGKSSGLEVHHLIEGRFAKNLGVKAADMPAVVMTKEEHRAFTNRWREAIGYNTKENLEKGVRTTSGANKEYIQKAAQEIYKDCGVIIVTEGSLLEFDFETLEPLACSLKTIIGKIDEKYWRRDNVRGKVRAYYVNVPEDSKKAYDASLNSIILRQNLAGCGDDQRRAQGIHQQMARGHWLQY